MIKGRDLIIYILENHLENEPIFKHGKFMGFTTVDKLAEEMNVGPETIKIWISLGRIKGAVMVGKEYLIPETAFVELFERKGNENE